MRLDQSDLYDKNAGIGNRRLRRGGSKLGHDFEININNTDIGLSPVTHTYELANQ